MKWFYTDNNFYLNTFSDQVYSIHYITCINTFISYIHYEVEYFQFKKTFTLQRHLINT